MARIVHFEIPVDDAERASRFYSNVFGWEFSRWGDQEYWLIKTGEQGTPGIDGGLTKRTDPPQPVVNTIDVDDIDAAAEKIKANGGTIVVEKSAIPTIGWLIYFKDTEGNLHGAMQNDPNAA